MSYDAVEKGKREESTRCRGGSRTARARIFPPLLKPFFILFLFGLFRIKFARSYLSDREASGVRRREIKRMQYAPTMRRFSTRLVLIPSRKQRGFEIVFLRDIAELFLALCKECQEAATLDKKREPLFHVIQQLGFAVCKRIFRKPP